MNKEKIIKEALKNVIDPIKKMDIITLKSLKDIKINNNTISIQLSVSPSSFKLKEVIRRNCISNLNKVFSDIEYDIKFILNDLFKPSGIDFKSKLSQKYFPESSKTFSLEIM